MRRVGLDGVFSASEFGTNKAWRLDSVLFFPLQISAIRVRLRGCYLSVVVVVALI